MRHPVIAGNWKMYKTTGETAEFVRKLRPKVASASHCEVIVAPPFTALSAAAAAAEGSNIGLAGQDVSWEREGAFTGDISPAQLLDAGCTHTIIGHSERRHYHGETDEQVNRKLKTALDAGLRAIVCVGETLEEREAGSTQTVLERQVTAAFRDLRALTGEPFSRIILAYEPVWAIGTGRTATPETAAESHRILRNVLARDFGGEIAKQLRILYGGSVKPDNIKGLMAKQGIDGALVGGASLNADSFAAIVNYL